MKYIAHALLLLLGLGVAFLRWVDLVNFTDLATGFVSAGSVWWRYGAIALLVVLALAASLMAARRPKSLERGCPVCGVLALAAAVACAAHNAVEGYVALGVPALLAGGNAWASAIDVAAAGIAVLGLLCAVWLCLVAFSQFGRGEAYRLPAGGVGFGIVGNLYFYAMLILRFSENQSSFHRLDPTVSVFAAAAAIWFTTVLLRAIYYPESGVGRKLYFAGLACFYLCLCVSLPQGVCDFMAANVTLGALSEQVLFAVFGVFGAAYASRALAKDLA